MTHIDDERRQAAELHALAGEVAVLIGYTLDPPTNAHHHAAVRLHGPDGAALAIIGRRGDRSRVVVYGTYPQGQSRVTFSLPSHAITVAASRGAHAIAGDIQRRLLPRYLADLATAVTVLHERGVATRAREELAAVLLATVAGLSRGQDSDTRITLNRDGHGVLPRGAIQIDGSGTHVSITLHGPAVLLVPVFVAALAGQTPPAPTVTNAEPDRR